MRKTPVDISEIRTKEQKMHAQPNVSVGTKEQCVRRAEREHLFYIESCQHFFKLHLRQYIRNTHIVAQLGENDKSVGLSQPTSLP